MKPCSTTARFAAMAVLINSLGCGALITWFGMATQGECQRYRDHRYEGKRFTSYTFRATHKTPKGVIVDASGMPVDLGRVDQTMDELEQCLGIKIHRCSIRVKLAPDAVKCPGHGFGFPCDVKESWMACPGVCTGVVEWPATAVVMPDMRALRHELSHVVMGAPGVHDNPVFKRCGE